MKTVCFWLISFCVFSSCRSLKQSGAPPLRLRFLGEYILPRDLSFQQTRVGGLSSVDYNPADGLFYLVSDDRSEHNPARYYTARIHLSQTGIDSVSFAGVRFLRQKNGATYPGRLQDSVNYPDPEGLRLNRQTGELVWSNEGERLVRNGMALLQNPSVNRMQQNGLLLDSFLLPDILRVSAEEKGPRRNGGFEGLTFTPDFKTLFVSVEEPLYDDGPRAGTGDSAAWVRFVEYGVESGKPTAQRAYRIDPVVKPPVPAGAFSINGVVDVLALDNRRLLVTERSYSTGYTGCNVRVYLADLRRADDVSANASLQTTPPKNFIRKTLLLNMDVLGREIHNIEGACFGPRLPSGKQSLLFVADDNFSNRERTQFLLFEVEK